jgi:hypothetical protein
MVSISAAPVAGAEAIADEAGVLVSAAKVGRSGRLAAAPVHSADLLIKQRRDRCFSIGWN